MWLRKIDEVEEELADLLATLNPGDVIDMDELRYVMRNQDKADITTVNILAAKRGIRFEQVGKETVKVVESW